MKKHLPVAVIFLIFFQGCLEYDFTTRVNSDGSIDRTVVIAGDSSEVITQKGNSAFGFQLEYEFQKRYRG